MSRFIAQSVSRQQFESLQLLLGGPELAFDAKALWPRHVPCLLSTRSDRLFI